ncbi:ATP-binding cassette domain-containing protein [Pendulispora brunnea]|uniref:ATP-binding cassette domain-containing protein n=1 Tax=Pendulispora brunnea TaxID=2905690 RepID=A0ABZ2K9Q5_9BACT
MTTDVPLIEIENAEVYRGDTRVFENLSLRIAQGRHTAILGPNGAGKSTLLRLLSRELYPVHREGSSVRILGHDRWDVFELRRQLGVVSHELQMQYTRTVRGLDVVLSGFFSSVGIGYHSHLNPSPEQRARAQSVLEQLGATALAQKAIGEMSSGEQRRCLLGRALVHDPACLVLDEPTASLDLKAKFELIGTIRQLVHQGRTLVLVTHHVDEIPPEVERVVLLRAGRVVADGKKSDILTSERLADLFETKMHLAEQRGFFYAIPD